MISYLGLGSNLNSPERQLRRAIVAIGNFPRTYITRVASIYKNKAQGRKAQPLFCNTVVAVNTSLHPKQLLKLCQEVENKQGRIRRVRWGARTLDIDILFFGLKKFDSPMLSIPHPRLYERDFVLIPLHEILRFPGCNFRV